MTDPTIALDYRPPQFETPMQSYTQLANLRNLSTQNQFQQQQVIGAGQENQMRQNQLDTMQTMNDAYKASLKPDGTFDMGVLTSALAKNNHGAAIPDVLKGMTAYQQSLSTLQETQGKVAQQQADAGGMLGLAAQKTAAPGGTYDPRLFLAGLQAAINAKAINPQIVAPHIQQIQQAMIADAQDPTGKSNTAGALAKQYADSLVSGSKQAMDIVNQGKADQGRADQGQAALQNANRQQTQNVLKDAGARLGATTTQQDYANVFKTLDAATQANFDPPANWTPQSGQKALQAGMTPAEIAADARTTSQNQATAAYRKTMVSQGQQRLNIDQQRADQAPGNPNNPNNVQGRFQTKEADAARSQMNQVAQQRIAIGNALAAQNGDQYVDPKTGKVAQQDMDDNIRAGLQKQFDNVTNQGYQILDRYSDDKSGGRIRSNELPPRAAQPNAPQTGAPQNPQNAAPQQPQQPPKPAAPNGAANAPGNPNQQMKVQVPGGRVTGTRAQIQAYLAKKGLQLQQ